MIHPPHTLAVLSTLTLVLSGYATATTLESRTEGKDAPITVGSRDCYPSEILAEAYSQALGNAGYEVDRRYRIGQREVYLPELEAGSIDVMPECTGSLLQYSAPNTEATLPEDVLATLIEALPESLDVLTPTETSDQDSYVIIAEFAKAHGSKSISDLMATAAEVGPPTLGRNSELEARPYGPEGLKELYGVEVAFILIENSGGALSMKAPKNNRIQLVSVYSADPVLANPELQILEDPKGMFLSSRVVPFVSERLGSGAVNTLNAVSAAPDLAGLIEMNWRSTEEAASPQTIACGWLIPKGIITER